MLNKDSFLQSGEGYFYVYAGEYTTQDKYIELYGILKRKKRINDV